MLHYVVTLLKVNSFTKIVCFLVVNSIVTYSAFEYKAFVDKDI